MAGRWGSRLVMTDAAPAEKTIRRPSGDFFMLAHKCVLLITLLCFTSSTRADVSSPPDPLVDSVQVATRWKSFDWSRASNSPLWTDKRWVAAPESPKGDDDTTHTRTIKALGHSWTAHLRTQTAPVVQFALSLSTDVTASQCETLAAKFGRPFGGEGIFSDQSVTTNFSDKVYATLVVRQHQWTVGTTRLDVACIGTRSNKSIPDDPNDTYVVNATFASVTGSPPLKPSFTLKCRNKSKLIIYDEREIVHPELLLWVDQETGKIKNESRNIISDKDSVFISDSQIRFTTTGDKIVTKYSINRFSGELFGDASDEKGKVATVTGSCERVTATAKF